MTQACPNCGGALPDDARFCPHCGQPVEGADVDNRDALSRLAAAAPTTLAERARSSLLVGSRRPVTALFADVVGSTSLVEQLDPEEWQTIINGAFDVMARAVYRYEGTVARLMGDGMLAFFGAPVAHEDDPARAVRAGLDMINDLASTTPSAGGADVDLLLRVGIDTGPVVVGNVGTDLTYEYTALGDAVNVAARLQALAKPGSVVVAGSTHRLVEHAFEARDLGLQDLKGKSDKVRVFGIIGALDRPRPVRGLPGLYSPMVGREDELDRLDACLASASTGSGGAVFLVGEAGIGKSRLIAEFHERARLRGGAMSWSTGACVSHGRGLPYHLVLSLVRSLLGLEDAAPSAAAAALRLELKTLLGDDWEPAHGPLAHLLSLPLGSDEEAAIERLDPKARHQRHLEALEALLVAIAKRSPTVLVCEDLHWADPASTELLASLLPTIRDHPLLLVATARPGTDPAFAELTGAASQILGEASARLPLASLSPDQSSALVAALLEFESLPAQIRSFILDKAAGNPFFLEEVIRTLIERGAIDHHDGMWTAGDTDLADELPENLHGLLLARIDMLPEEVRQTVRFASVIGRRFRTPLLRSVIGDGDGHALEDRLDQLDRAGLIERVDEDDGAWEFRHVLLQEAAYDSLLHADRQVMHRQVAEELDSSDQGAEVAGEIARHWEGAGDIGRAVDQLVIAGQHALARFATHEARGFLDRAAAHLDELDDPTRERQRVEVALGRVRSGATFLPFSDHLEILKQALPRADELGDEALTATLLVEQARQLAAVGSREALAELRELLPSIESLADSLGDERLRALPMSIEAQRRWGRGDLRGVVEIFTTLTPLLEANLDYAGAAESAGLAAVAAGRLGDFVDAADGIDRAREFALRSGDPNAILDVDIWEGMIASERGELLAGIDVTRRGVEEAIRVDNKECQVVGHLVIGEQEWRRGEFEQALESFEQAKDVAQYCEIVNVELVAGAWLSAARSGATRSDSLAELDESLARARELGDRFSEAHVLLLRAQARQRSLPADVEGALADLEAALAIFEEMGARPALARALQACADVLVLAGRASEADAQRERSQQLLTDLGIREPADAV